MCLLQHVDAHNFEGFFPNVLPFFVLVGLENNVEGALQIETPPFSRTANFRVNVGVFILKNVFEL